MKAILILMAAISLAACTYNNYGPQPGIPVGPQSTDQRVGPPMDYTTVPLDANRVELAEDMTQACVVKTKTNSLSSSAFSESEIATFCGCESHAIAAVITPDEIRYAVEHNVLPERLQLIDATVIEQCRAKIFGGRRS